MLLEAGADLNARSSDNVGLLGLIFDRGDRLGKWSHHPEAWPLAKALLNKIRQFNVHPPDVVMMARGSTFRCEQYLQEIFDYDQEFCISEEDIIPALGDRPMTSRFRQLLTRLGPIGVTKTMLTKAKDSDSLSLLVKHEPCCKVTAQIVEAHEECDALRCLLDHEPDITPS